MFQEEVLRTLAALGATPCSTTSLQDSVRPVVERIQELAEVLMELLDSMVIHFLEENMDSEAALAQVGAQMEGLKAAFPREAQASEKAVPGDLVHGVPERIPMLVKVLLREVMMALATSAEPPSLATSNQDSNFLRA